MRKGLLTGAFLGGLIVFVWHIISWMGLPWHMATLNVFNKPKEVSEIIAKNVSRPGMYILPKIEKNEECEKMFAHDEVGTGKAKPMMFAAIQNQEMDATSFPSYFGLLITYIIVSFFVTLIASFIKTSYYMEKVGMITLIGLIIGIMTYVPCAIWWGFSSAYAMVGILDLVISWFFAGLVIAKVVK